MSFNPGIGQNNTYQEVLNFIQNSYSLAELEKNVPIKCLIDHNIGMVWYSRV